MWLDGLIGGLAAAAVGAAVILPPILHGAHGDTASLGVALAYPIGDLLLLVFTLGALGMTGWRPGRVWLLIAVAMLCSAVADSAYLYLTATDSYHVGDWVQFLWPASAVLLAIAAWTPWPRPARRRVEDWRLVSVPSFSLLAALGVLIYGNLPQPADAGRAGARGRDGADGVRAPDDDGAREHRDARRLAPPGADRPADGPRQPPAADGGPQRRLPPRLGRRDVGADAVRPQRLQALQRHLRPPRRRRAAGAPLGQAEDRRRPLRHRLPHGRRRVLRAAARLRRADRRADGGLRRGPLRARPGLLDRRRARRRQHSPRTRGPRRGDAARRPAPLPAQGGDARGLRRAPAARRAAAGLPGAPPRPAGAPARRRRARAGGRPAPGDGRRRARRARPRRRAARRRQDRDPRRDPHQARPAERGGVGLHEPPHDPRRADPRGRRRSAPGRRAGALLPRALRRQGLPRRPERRADPARRADHLRLRRLRRDDLRALLQLRDPHRRGDRRAARLRRHAVRPGCGGGVHRLVRGVAVSAAGGGGESAPGCHTRGWIEPPALASVDADDAQHALAAGQRNGHLVAGAAADERAGDGRLG